MRDPNLVRKEMLTLDEVMPLVIMPVENPDPEAPLDPLKMIKGDMINMAVPKLQTFASFGVACTRCKIPGEYFGKEKYENIPFYHLNLYAMKNGRETQMLKDFVVPLKKGGLDELSNYQTICFDCHKKKVNPAPDLENRRRKRAKKRSENRAKKASGEVKAKTGEKKPRSI